MDRVTVFQGQLPLETDLLRAQQYAMISIASLSQSILGASTIVDGFALAPTNPVSAQAILGPGSAYQLENLESSQWSSLPIDDHTILKQGISLDPIALTFTPPNTAGYSQCVLVQVAYEELDGQPQERPYYDSANPQIGFSGPGNDGAADNTVRKGGIAAALKYGVAAPSGTQTIPTPDPGYAGLWVVSLAAGQASVSAGNIAPYALAPTIPSTLPGVPTGVQSGRWTYGADTGASADEIEVDLTPTPPSIPIGFGLRFIKENPNQTVSPHITLLTQSGKQRFPIVKAAGTAPAVSDINGAMALLFDGVSFRVFGLTVSDVRALIPAPPVFPTIPTYTGNTGVAVSATDVITLNIPSLTAAPQLEPADAFPVFSATDEQHHQVSLQALADEIAALIGAGDDPTVSGAYVQYRIFKASGVFVPDANCHAVEVVGCWGAGGGGAYSGGVAAGGGGGGWSAGVFIVTPGQSYQVGIGAGGAGGAAYAQTGGTGGSTNFDVFCASAGGAGGSGNSPGGGGSAYGQASVYGQNGGAGNAPGAGNYFPGYGGASFGSGSNVTTGIVYSGEAPGQGGTAGNNTGAPGSTPNGGTGANGLLILKQVVTQT